MNIFEKIESKWKICFEESRKLEVINSLRKDKTKKIINHPVWGNNHVGDGEIGKWKKIVPEHLHDYFCKKIGVINGPFTKKEDYFIKT